MRLTLLVLSLLLLSLTSFSQSNNSTKSCWIKVETKQGPVFCRVPCQKIDQIAKLKGGSTK